MSVIIRHCELVDSETDPGFGATEVTVSSYVGQGDDITQVCRKAVFKATRIADRIRMVEKEVQPMDRDQRAMQMVITEMNMP